MGGGFAVPKKPAGWNRVRAAGLNLGKEEFAKVISAQNGWGCRQHLVEVEISSSHGLQPQSRRADCICWSDSPGTVFKVAIQSPREAAHVVFVGGDKAASSTLRFIIPSSQASKWLCACSVGGKWMLLLVNVLQC
jgi:hypothetical protein